MDTVICLCDYTGTFAKPWIDAGYKAVLVDPQHKERSVEGAVTRIPLTVLECAGQIGGILRNNRIAFVAGFPPCTDVAVSGARWFEEKTRQDKYFQAKAALVAEQCRMMGILSGAPWFFENPISVFSKIFGKPDYIFNPYEFSGYCRDDNYTKKTCLWTGGGFVMPTKCIDPSLPKPDSRIHHAPPSEDRANFRSATPLGFAKAVFEYNAVKHAAVSSF